MEPKIIWLFALVYLLTTKYSFAVDPAKSSKQQSPKIINKIYSSMKAALSILHRDVKKYISGSICPNKDAVKTWVSTIRSIESYLKEDDAVEYRFAHTKRYYNRIDSYYREYFTLSSILDRTDYSPANDSIFLNFGHKAMTELSGNVSDTLNLMSEMLRAFGLSIWEQRLLRSKQAKETVDQCNACRDKIENLLWIYSPLMKKEIQGMLVISYANLMHIYTECFRGPEGEGADDFSDKLFRYIGKSHERFQKYYDHIKASCKCKVDPWGYRISKSRVVIEGQPFRSSRALDFCVKGVVDASLFLNYSDTNDHLSKIRMNKNGIQGYFESQTINMPIKYLTETNMLHCFRVEKSAFDFCISYISAGATMMKRRCVYEDREKITLDNYFKSKLFYTIISDDSDAEWMIKDVLRSPSTQLSMPKTDVYWCEFNGELPNATVVKVGRKSYVLRPSTFSHLKDWKSWTPSYFDADKKIFLAYPMDLCSDYKKSYLPSYDILTGCGVQWAKPTNETIPHALVATTSNIYYLGVPIFICRGAYDGDPSRIGRFDGHQCIIIHWTNNVINKYEILIQPKKK